MLRPHPDLARGASVRCNISNHTLLTLSYAPTNENAPGIVSRVELHPCVRSPTFSFHDVVTGGGVTQVSFQGQVWLSVALMWQLGHRAFGIEAC